MASELIWGLDLGGTKIECAVLESANYKVLCRNRVETQREKGYQHIVDQVGRLIEMTVESVGSRPKNIGIGMPGVPDPVTNMLKNGNTLCLNGMPFKEDVEKLVGANVVIANDANCFALAETHMGIVPDICPEAEVVLGVVLGTGVGGGVVVNGKALKGHHGIGGEWGHIFLDESGGDECYCNTRGCVESIISGTALEKYYASISGKPLRLKEIAQRVDIDPNAKKTVDRLVQMFAKGIVQIVNVLDPDVIVVGGGVSNIGSLCERAIPEMNKYIFNDAFNAKLVLPKLGDSAGVFGAAMLVEQE